MQEDKEISISLEYIFSFILEMIKLFYNIF